MAIESECRFQYNSDVPSRPLLLESPCRPSAGPALEAEDETVGMRCVCGSLLARRVPEGIELKCRRCKRAMIIAWSVFQGTS